MRTYIRTICKNVLHYYKNQKCKHFIQSLFNIYQKKIDFISNVICISKYFKCIHSSHSFQNINQKLSISVCCKGKNSCSSLYLLNVLLSTFVKNKFKCNSMKMPLYYYNMIVVIMNFITIVDIFHRSYLY